MQSSFVSNHQDNPGEVVEVIEVITVAEQQPSDQETSRFDLKSPSRKVPTDLKQDKNAYQAENTNSKLAETPVQNTPSGACKYDDYNFDETSPSPNYNPGTPRYAQESPSASYTPATPGSVYNSQEGYSPYQPSPSPTGGYQSTPSHNSYVPTPSPGQNYQPTPSPGYGAPSPLGYSPMTPGSHANSPYTPQTPGASLDMIGQSVSLSLKKKRILNLKF